MQGIKQAAGRTTGWWNGVLEHGERAQCTSPRHEYRRMASDLESMVEIRLPMLISSLTLAFLPYRSNQIRTEALLVHPEVLLCISSNAACL